MAELATPSAATMFDGGKVEKADRHERIEKPEKPDEAAYKALLNKKEKELEKIVAGFNAVRAKLDVAQPKNQDSPTNERRNQIRGEMDAIKEKQAGGKAGRNNVFDQIKKLDEQLKSRIAEQKTARARVAFKNVEEVDREIQRLEQQVEGGMMKLVDEKKALNEIPNLKKLRKSFAGFDEAQKGIDDTKAKIKALKETLDNPEAKAMSEKFNKLKEELDQMSAEQNEARKHINELRDERTKLYEQKEEKRNEIKKVRDDYRQAGRALQEYEFKARQKKREHIKAEKDNYEKEKRKERAQKMLEEASDKAYMDEIRRAERVLRFLDPSLLPASKAPLQAPSQFQAQAQRTVDDSALKGTRVVRKDELEEVYFKGTGGKKGKKGRKGAVAETPTTPTITKFNCPPSVMEDCSAMGIDPPMSAAEIPAVCEKVKAKLDHWKADQDAQTKRNIDKARKEVERLEAEEISAPAPPAAPTSNGEHKATASVEEGGSIANEVELIKKATEDVVADLKGASIEDKE
ncbi:hypothetical protein B7494_g141 [Chlorociboria aeruginascens]|nr:hypothetical protein B7494_g141 [Chlorociboria aeruginascens]